jgi:hypothetical protein
MKTKLLGVVLASVLVPTVGAQSVPFRGIQTQGNLIVPIADGCWLGWHRNANGGCSRDTYGLFGLGVEYVPPPYHYYQTGLGRVCGGRGIYKVCNVFGYCWFVCN